MILAAMLLAAAAPAQSADATRTFQKCISCHSLDPAEADLPGPHLQGVLGRRAATVPDFEYSVALQKAGAGGLVWTREALETFLDDPESVAPGTMMAKPPRTTPEERERLYSLFSNAN
jgi:cytochrome c2